MFGWFRKYVRKIGIFGVKVEFHPPTEIAAPVTPPAPPKSDESPRAITPAVVPAQRHQAGSVAADKAAFLSQVKKKKNSEAEMAADYEQVLDDLIAWSEAQGGLLTFSPKPAKNSQATVAYRFRGLVFWDVWPQKQQPTKFTFEYNFDRAYLLTEFANLSADGQPASETLPTVWFRDLIPEAARQRLKQLLGEVLGRLTSRPAAPS